MISVSSRLDLRMQFLIDPIHQRTSADEGFRDEIRGWRLQSCSDKSIEDLSRMFNPIIRGWLHYYGRFYRSAVYLSLLQLDKALARWASQKFKRLRRRQRRANQWVARLSRRAPALFAHWQLVKKGSVVGAV